MKAITLQKYLNNMFGVMTVLSLDYEIKNRTFFKCKCNRCSNLTSVRSDHLLKNPKSCSFCTNNLQKEIADKAIADRSLIEYFKMLDIINS